MGWHVAVVRVEEGRAEKGAKHGRRAEWRTVVVARWWWSGYEEVLPL